MTTAVGHILLLFTAGQHFIAGTSHLPRLPLYFVDAQISPGKIPGGEAQPSGPSHR